MLLWRHGRTAHNHSGTWQGQLDVPLDEVGLVQAEAAGDVLAGVLQRWTDAARPVRVVSSDLSRARATAAAVERRLGLPVEEDKRLREIDGGAWQGLTHEGITAAGMGDDLAAWRRGEDVRVGGAERRSEAGRRAATVIAEHTDAQDGGLLLVVSHGGVVRGATLSLLGLPVGQWDRLGALRNCHWVDLAPREPYWRLLAYNAGVEDPIWSPAPVPG